MVAAISGEMYHARLLDGPTSLALNRSDKYGIKIS